MSQPDIDPYLTLGVPKDATLTEVRAAHRKRVLKCHPDKIQDQAQRDAAQEEFQEVQAAYELLSDPTRRLRYDQKIKLQELRRELEKKRRAEEAEMAARGMPTTREMREGHPVEERAPFDPTYFEEQRFTEEPRSFSRKNDDFGGKRPKAKEEKKKTRVPPSSERAAKESRENTKAEHSERQRRRDRERRGQQSEKYESFGPFVVSDGGSDSSDSEAYIPKPSRRSREPRESRSRPTESFSRRHERPVYEDDQYHEKVSRAEEHIERSKYDNYRPRTSPQRSRGYESAEPETTPRRSGRSSRANPVRSSSRHNSSYEDLEPRYDSGKPPKIPTATTMPGPKTSLRPTLFGAVRSATTAGYSRPARESSRTRTDDNPLSKMVNDLFPPRSSKLREKYDSGYSSPNTPEMAPKGSPKVAARYKIDPDPIIIEPSKPSRHRTLSPERERERVPRMAPPKRASTTQSYMSESGPRVEVRTVRSSARPSRTHANVEYSPQIRSEDVKYTREIRPGDVNMSPGHNYYYSDHIRTRRPSVAYA
ncbi:hypothetical protein N7466_002025 [Penicillium verhagenii]|uniref:uncharacterized protein n=1 Tax=Penicillium verhagenii TaxID=1562060 RepID=UPI0025456D6F|nr:uncharacterized protein N7466_002025 [Penicillium verhagenii]KAJ5938891.1 hypothetical protein N7466_002025 [Penicillium verhagenii]